jgi:chorismate synthase
MSLNTFGRLLRVTTFGESHGPAIGCVIDGLPPGIAIAPEDFRHVIERRDTGKSRHTSQRREADEVEILSGVFEGVTTGTSLALQIRNVDARSKDYGNLVDVFRPAHADYTYLQKYGIRDHRGGGRSSARETTVRVAAGVIAKRWLADRFGVRVRGYVSKLGPHEPARLDWDAVEDNPFFWPDAAFVPELEAYMDALRKSGDSVGARVTVVAEGVPPGWGAPRYAKLDAELAAALMGINAVKGVEIGDGMAAAGQRGTEHRDEMYRRATSGEGNVAAYALKVGKEKLEEFRLSKEIKSKGVKTYEQELREKLKQEIMAELKQEVQAEIGTASGKPRLVGGSTPTTESKPNDYKSIKDIFGR